MPKLSTQNIDGMGGKQRVFNAQESLPLNVVNDIGALICSGPEIHTGAQGWGYDNLRHYKDTEAWLTY
jgi:hypothetical protein